MKVVSVVGARPNFMKIAPFARAVARYNAKAPGQGGQPIDHCLVHTGQHYDVQMSEGFFKALNIPSPTVNLEIGSGTHAEQVGRTMIAFEKVVKDFQPDWVVVVGDVNATCACSITAKKEVVKLAHIEAGLRSFDLAMPEEINRMVTDRLSDMLFTTDELADANLRSEGVPDEKIRRVGNVMIDTLFANREKAARLTLGEIAERHALKGHAGAFDANNLAPGTFAVLTMHRPSNVDDRGVMGRMAGFLVDEVSRELAIAWPIHPRTMARLKEFGLWEKVAACPGVALLEPVGYHEMLKLNMDCRLMLTDSGGLQEECCVLGTPCLTLRSNTERPVTLTEHGGVSVLVGNDIEKIRAGYAEMKEKPRRPHAPPLWDGRTAERIVAALVG